jgi:multidrug efflux system membrane fusion protein
VIPSVAVQAGQQGSFVYVVADGRAQVRPVSIARVQGTDSVIASGITPGEVVVTDGQLRLTPNARIAQRGGGAGDAGGRGPAGPGDTAGQAAGAAAGTGRAATGEAR